MSSKSQILYTLLMLVSRGDLQVLSVFHPLPSQAQEERGLQDEIQCGSLTCKNKGQCMPGHEEFWPNHDFPVCDCTMAWEVQGSPPNIGIQRFAGRSCEIAVQHDDYCKGGSTHDSFCVNGGHCRSKAKDFDKKPCKCPDGYTGRHCEYSLHEVQSECSLDCNNVGRCEHGSNPYSDTGANGILDLQQGGSEKYMYCVCDKGYAGTNCEYEFTKCGGRRHYCFHGSTCIDADQSDSGKPECECEIATGTKIIGDACEFRATDNCAHPYPPTGPVNPENKILSTEIPFCVNNGICVKDDTDNTAFYCECDETQWTGKRCEIKVKAHDATPAPTPAWTDTWAPTIYGSVTDWPTADWGDDDDDDDEPTPAPTPVKHPGRDSDTLKKSPNAEPSEEDGMSGFGKFVLALLGMIAVVTGGLFVQRHYRRAQFGKEAIVFHHGHSVAGNSGHAAAAADKNLQLDMISEETEMTTIDIDGPTTTEPPSPHTWLDGSNDASSPSSGEIL